MSLITFEYVLFYLFKSSKYFYEFFYIRGVAIFFVLGKFHKIKIFTSSLDLPFVVFFSGFPSVNFSRYSILL